MNYKQVTLRQYLYISDIATDNDYNDEQKIGQYIEIIYGKNLNEIPIYELNSYINELQFLSKEIKLDKIQKNYVLNGHKYNLTQNIENITAAQYIDFTNLSKADEKEYEKIIACFLIPDGHKYNDGYEMQEEYDDILDYMDIITVNTIASFLYGALMNYTKRTLDYLTLQTLKTKTMTWREKWTILKTINQSKQVMQHMARLTT